MGKSEISSSVIGDKVMDKLEGLDHIAYIRFASIYREFTDIATMKREVDKLLDVKSGAPLPGQLFLITPDEYDGTKKLRRRHKEK